MEDNKWSPLMEQNWKRMHVILDQQLPSTTKRRRNVFAFLLFAGISIAFILLLWSDDYNKKIKNAKNITKPFYAAKSVSGTTFNNGYDTICDLGFEDKNMVYPSEKSLSEITKVINKRENVDFGKSRPNSALTTNQSEYVHEDSILNNAIAIDNFDTKTVHPFDNVTNVRTHILSVEKPENKNYFIMSNQTRDVHIHSTNSIQVAIRDNWQYGINGTLSFNKMASPQQYYAGVFARKSIGKLLIFEGQIGIKNFNRYSSFLRRNNILDSTTNVVMGSSVSAAENIYNLDSKILTNNTIDYVNESIIESTLASAQYLETGVSIGLRINKQMIVKGGISVGRFIHAAYKIDDYSRSLYGAFNKNQSLDDVDLTQADNLLKKWITNLFFEADYKVLKRWELTSAIQLGSAKNTLGYSDNGLSILGNPTNQIPILFEQPEKGTINISIGARYDLN
jgi:hypothetical protein